MPIARRAVISDLNPNLMSMGQIRLQGIFGDAVLADLMTLQVRVPCSDADPDYVDLPVVFAVTDEIVQDCDFIIPSYVVQLIYAAGSFAPQSSLSCNIVTISQSQALRVNSDDHNGDGIVQSSERSNTVDDPFTESQTDNVDRPSTNLTNIDDRASLIDEQKADATLDQYWHLASRRKGGMCVEDGVLYHQDEVAGHKVKQLCVPYGRRLEVMRLAHDAVTAGHLGSHKTCERIRLNFFWPNLKHDVTSYVSSCRPCQLRPRSRRDDRVPIMPIVRPSVPFAYFHFIPGQITFA